MNTPNPYVGRNIEELNEALRDIQAIIERAKEYGKQFPHQSLIWELAEAERGYIILAIQDSNAPKALIININDLTPSVSVRGYDTVFVYFNSNPSAKLIAEVGDTTGKLWQGIIEYRANFLYAFSSADMPVSPTGYQLTTTKNYNVPF